MRAVNRMVSKSLAVAAVLAALVFHAQAQETIPICTAAKGTKYEQAKADFPELKDVVK